MSPITDEQQLSAGKYFEYLRPARMGPVGTAEGKQFHTALVACIRTGAVNAILVSVQINYSHSWPISER